jgi:glycosyltransferase involved in cell wall biosynthesis
LILVSIIIPTYNRVHLLGQAIDSVLNQTYKEWECIVVDDGSIDHTEELLEFYLEDHRIKFLKRESQPKGASHCRNIGLREAKGEYCMFLDSDDLLLPHCLESRINFSQEFYTNKFWVFPMFTEHKGERKVLEIPEAKNYISEFLRYRIHWQTMCTFWRTDFVRSIKGFNPAYPRLNDPEVHIRAMLVAGKGFKIINGFQPDTVYRFDPNPRNKKDFALKYYKSLSLFVIDIPKYLREYQQEEKIPFIKAYLNDYLEISFNFINRKKNLELFRLFYRNKILSLPEYIKLCSDYYLYLASKKGFLGQKEILKLRLT